MKTEETKICHCGKEFILTRQDKKHCSIECARLYYNTHSVNPNKICIICNGPISLNKRTGKMCYKCENNKYKNYKQERIAKEAKVKVIKTTLNVKKYKPRVFEFNEKTAVDWIEMVIARNEMVSINELFVDLIDIYYVTGHNDDYDHYTPRVQMQYMWKQCLNWYLKNKNK